MLHLRDWERSCFSAIFGKNPTCLDQDIGRKLPLETKQGVAKADDSSAQKMAGYGNDIWRNFKRGKQMTKVTKK